MQRPYTMGWVPYLPIGVLNTLHHLKKRKMRFITPHYMTPVSYCPCLVFFGPLQTCNFMILSEQWPLWRYLTPDVYYMFTLKSWVGWSLIHWLKKILVFETNFHWQSVILVTGFSIFFSTAILMPCFGAASSTLFLDSLLLYT